MDTLLRDVRHAVRTLARQRGFTLAALTTLALGIGANAAMFSIVYDLILRPLPYPDSDAIVRVGQLPAGMSRSTLALNNYSMRLLLEEAESFEQLAGLHAAAGRMGGSGGQRQAAGNGRLPGVVSAAPGEAAPGTAVRGGRGTGRRGSGRAPELRRLGRPIRGGSGRGGDRPRDRRRDARGSRGPRRGVLLSEPRYGDLDAPRAADPRAAGFAGRGRPGLPDVRLRLRLRTGAAPCGRLAGAGRGRGRDPAGAPGRSAPRGLARPRPGGERCAGLRDAGDSTAGGDDRRVSAGAARAQRGDRARAVDRVLQRGGASARARSVAPTGAGRLRRPRRRARPTAAAAPDRERHPGSGRWHARTGCGRRRAWCGSRADTGRRRPAGRGERRR